MMADDLGGRRSEDEAVQIRSMRELAIDDDEADTTPLLAMDICQAEENNKASPVPNGTAATQTEKRKRLASLDVFRGLTIAVMILVDDAGGLWPSINHSPWNGVTLADFVMPFFLFIIGISIVLALKNASQSLESLQKVFTRSLKLFLLGILLQGGYFHGVNDLTYGVDIRRLRIMGILQRISIAYFIVAICELFTKKTTDGNRGVTKMMKMYPWHWIIVLMLTCIYLGLLYGLNVPDWSFQPFLSEESDSETDQPNLKVMCNVRGDLGPACNAVGFLDRAIMGLSHLYQYPVYIRTKECSTLSPGYGPLPSNAPNWCSSPFDPEGLLSSVMAVVSCFIGAHYGHVLTQFKDHRRRLMEWISFAVVLMVLGLILTYFGLPLNKPLYTLSYVFYTASFAGAMFCVFYMLVDILNWRKPFMLLEWMGMNALLIFVLAASEVFPAAIQGFYWKLPTNNLVSIIENEILPTMIQSRKWCKMFYVLLEILFWCLIAGFLKMNGIFWKF